MRLPGEMARIALPFYRLLFPASQLRQPPQALSPAALGNGAIILPSTHSQDARPSRNNGNAIDTRNRRTLAGKRLRTT